MNTLLPLMQRAAQKAGEMALSYQTKPIDITLKPEAGGSPVSEIDLAVNAYLRHTLCAADPTIGWLSEETEDDTARLNCQRLWVVDPIDGTRSMLEHMMGILTNEEDPTCDQRQFTISLALVEAGDPVLGVIYAPLTNDLFSAAKGQGMTVNGKPLTPYPAPNCLEDTVLLSSVSEEKEGLLTSLKPHMPLRMCGSAAYKMAQAAALKNHVFVSIKPKSEWDIAAGTLMCQEQGLRVTDLAGKEPLFNQANVTVSGTIVSPPCLYDDLKNLCPNETRGGYSV